MKEKEKKTPKESIENKKAFKMYCELKDKFADDIFEKISKKFNKQIKTIYNWSSTFKWEEKWEKDREEKHRKVLEKLDADKQAQDIRMVQKIITNLKIAEDSVMGSLDGAYSPKDYELLAKLYLLLTDRPTERTEANNKIELSAADKETLSNISFNIEEDIKSTELEIELMDKKEEK